MADANESAFESDTHALQHYKRQHDILQKQLEDANNEMQDFMESSKELQDELERELARIEANERDVKRGLEQAKYEVDEWKTKYTTALRDHTTTMSHMQKELESLRSSEKSLRGRLRDMELDNDDLEKAEREKESSLQDLEARYGRSIERIALLEEELVTKAQLEEEVQRLKDELRDVREELAINRDRAPVHTSESGVEHSDSKERQRDDPDSPTPSAPNHTRRSPPPQRDRSPIPPVPVLQSLPALGNASLARSTKTRNLVLSPTTTSTPKTVREIRTNKVIKDMKSMTDRVKQLTSRLDSRRNLVMAGSSIPRASMSPGGPGSLSRSTTTRRFGNSSLGKSVGPGTTQAISDAESMPSRPQSRASSRAGMHDSDILVASTRPTSRTAMRMSMGGSSGRTAIPVRPSSRMSSSHGGSRPETPSLPTRSETPTMGTRPGWNTSLSSSTAGRRASTSLATSTRSRRVSSTFVPPLPNSTAQQSALSASVRRPPSRTDDVKSRRVSVGVLNKSVRK
ncbi:NADH:ubiquinone oxidoreductase [Microbotryomycetes sp. JL221]|nr:NADH:ubiquinone oxidoreductase [Microbotryomycetes sp. JL221]